MKQTDTHQIWLPVAFKQAGEHTFVHLADANRLDLSLGFFHHSLDALPEEGKPKKIILLQTWLQQSAKIKTDQAVTMIFHVSRCGSTLLCQNLKATKKVLVLSEPAMLGQIYNKPWIIPIALRKQVLQKVVMQWSVWAKQQKKILAIKTSSALLPLQAQLRQDLEHYKAIFLYREPSAVVESLSRKSARFLITYFADLDQHFSSETQASYPEKHLQAVYAYTTAIKAIPLSHSSHTFLIDYEDLAGQFKQVILFLGIDIGNLEEKPLWSTYWSAKSRGFEEKRYVPIAKRTLLDFQLKYQSLLIPLKRDYQTLKTIPQKKQG